MSYVDNAPLITAWDTRVQALKDMIATLYDGSTTNVVIEDISEANMLLSSMRLDSNEQAPGITIENPELVSNEHAPQVVVETPTLVVEPEDEGDQEEEEEDTVDETVEETVEETVDEPSEETEEEVANEDTEE